MVKRKIETGVDKLVELVDRKKKVELNEAVKALGVSKIVVQEWAGFLEEQGMISIEYSLSKVYLVERKLSPKDVQKKKREYGAKKEAFVRKVETALQTLESESLGFEQIKEKFNELEKDIGSEIQRVKNEVDELRHYEELKKNLDQEILQQKLDYQKMFDDLHKQIQFEEKKYDSIIEQVMKEKSRISEEKLDLDYIEKKEDNLQRRIDALKEILKSLEGEVQIKSSQMKRETVKLNELQKVADRLIAEVKKKKEADLKPLVAASQASQDKVLSIQDEILEKVQAKKADIEGVRTEGKRITEEFERFFQKRADTEKLLARINNEKFDMEKEMQGLINSAKAFEIATKSADVRHHVKDLNEKFQELDKKKEVFKQDMVELNERVLGKKGKR
ncbi:hypothetical protein ACFL1B_01420 [Nanoarchaeota archaeon]